MTYPEIKQLTLSYNLTPVDAVVVPGYSAHEAGPSHLSEFAFDMGRAVCTTIGEQTGVEPPLILATERSLTDGPTTGEMLIARVDRPQNFGLVPDFDNNRLLNTNLQIKALARWLAFRREDNPMYRFNMVAFGFHIPRLERAMAREDLRPYQYFRVEDLMTAHYSKNARTEELFKERYGMDVTWDEVAIRALPDFQRRERYTQMLDRIADGRLLDWISCYCERGRYDDVRADGKPIHEEPRFRPHKTRSK